MAIDGTVIGSVDAYGHYLKEKKFRGREPSFILFSSTSDLAEDQISDRGKWHRPTETIKPLEGQI